VAVAGVLRCLVRARVAGMTMAHKARFLQTLRPWARNYSSVVVSSMLDVADPTRATAAAAASAGVGAMRSGIDTEDMPAPIAVREGVRGLQQVRVLRVLVRISRVCARQRSPPLAVLDSLAKLVLIFGRGADAPQLIAHAVPVWLELIPRKQDAGGAEGLFDLPNVVRVRCGRVCGVRDRRLCARRRSSAWTPCSSLSCFTPTRSCWAWHVDSCVHSQYVLVGCAPHVVINASQARDNGMHAAYVIGWLAARLDSGWQCDLEMCGVDIWL
jgi:hypothetical protein